MMKSKIDESDLAYHKFVISQLNDSQKVAESWSRFLSGKYKLGNGDSINPEGDIVRKEEEPIKLKEVNKK